MKTCQEQLIKDVRKQFYDTIQKSVQECSQISTLEFPDKLWQQHRITLIKEIIVLFGKIKVQSVSINHDRTLQITNSNDIPNNAKKIIIEFIKDD
jgi:hypothetical protein